MNKIIRNIIVIVAILGLLAFAASYFIKKQTKKNSPQDTAELVEGNFALKMVYCQPYKKGRVIFGSEAEGALQPFGKYWRLGANEATTFETNSDLIIEGNKLEKGKYSIYAVPGKNTWKFGFNKEANRWGASEPDYSKDLFIVEVPVAHTQEPLEQFKIKIIHNKVVFIWDVYEVALPYSILK